MKLEVVIIQLVKWKGVIMVASDLTLLVTEPTPYGLHDPKLAVNLCVKLGIPSSVIINLSNKNDSKIEEYARAVNLPIIVKIPFYRKYAEAYVLTLVAIIGIFVFVLNAKQISERQVHIIKFIGGAIMVLLCVVLLVNPTLIMRV